MRLLNRLKDLPNVFSWIGTELLKWLINDPPNIKQTTSNFNALCFAIKPADVLLVSGDSRVSSVIQNFTNSSWSHVVIYLGRINDIADESTREHVRAMYDGNDTDQLIIEPMPDKGTIISSLAKYSAANVRLCRPSGISPDDVNLVIQYVVGHLGSDYDIRQILDLGRYMSTSMLLPKKWKSSLFNANTNDSNQMLCSTLIAEAFSHVKYPILPIIKEDKKGNITLYNRNNKLCVPKDFDTSPYFEIKKFPLFPLSTLRDNHMISWDKNETIYNDDNEIPENNKN